MSEEKLTNEEIETNEKIVENVEDEDVKKNVEDIDRNKKVSCKEKKWTCEDSPLWRIFMKSYLEQEKKLEKEDKFDRRKASTLPRFPKVKSSEQIPPLDSCFPLNTFNLEERARLPDKLNPRDKIRLWRNMRNDPTIDEMNFLKDSLPEISRIDSGKWPETWPCVQRDLAGEKKKLEKLEKRRKKGLLPRQEDSDSDNNLDEPRDDYADHKELGHARVPISCPGVKKTRLVDRAVGRHPGLVDGDYVLFLFGSSDEDEDDDNGKVEKNRTHANVCLRGLKGMHLAELSDKRAREKTWKFCFYQAIVALLAKTQLRYKFAWSVNIDYIFDHAWMLFVHVGSINVKERILLDDVIVYNYKYSVELELVHEMKDGPRITGVSWNYEERDLRNMLEATRPELMKTKEVIDWKKPRIKKSPPVHPISRKIEKWFDDLPEIYRNCVLRTSKFALAFWKDGTFWYLFNPYRCDEFGMWHEPGYACIMKFCTKASLKRHLMILILRAYSYETQSPAKFSREKSNDLRDNSKTEQPEVDENSESDDASDETGSDQDEAKNVFAIQIYQMIYHCVQIHNVKLLQRKPPGPRTEKIAKEIDDCETDLPTSRLPCGEKSFDDNIYDENEDDDSYEKSAWLKRYKVTWARFASSRKKNVKEEVHNDSKLRWHQYHVEEPRMIFSLWGEIHPTGRLFAEENRGRQIHACYVVSAGMTRIQAPEYWSSETLDAIVMCGDRYYSTSKAEWQRKTGREFNGLDTSGSYLGKYFKIGEILFEADILPDVCGRLYVKNDRNLWRIVEQLFLAYHFAILTCEYWNLGIAKFSGAYYMIDVDTNGPPLFQYGDGVAYVIRTTSFREFIKILVLTIGSSECSSFAIKPIVIGKMIDLGTTNRRETAGRPQFRKLECPYDDSAKGLKKWKSKDREGKKRTIDKISCKNGCAN